jgi:predicted glycogen debranching enzyme
VARGILVTFAEFLDRGMLPNRFPDAGEAPEYNTVDATLWYVEAIRRYVEETGDAAIVAQLFPAIEDIVRWHRAGTRYGIHVDAADGLLASGEEGVQLTWMDAKVGDDVITPRTGKAVEINALWYRTLLTAADFAARLKRAPDEYCAQAEHVRASFAKFWNDAAAYTYDVIEGPWRSDASIRPNAVIAASLAPELFTPEQLRSIVLQASRTLATSAGLRSLAPDDPRFAGHYRGGPRERDRVYHQGTVWTWLLGPYVCAHVAAFGDRDRARELLGGIEHLLMAYGVGTLPEIADGDAPYEPRGCFAQAWSVSEILRAWKEVSR